MIHHLSVGTNDLKRAKAFYDPVMTVLGLRLLSRDDKSLDYGVGMVQFSLETPVDGHPASPEMVDISLSWRKTRIWSMNSTAWH